MKNSMRVLGMVLCIAMLAAIMTACGNGSTSGGDTTNSVSVSSSSPTTAASTVDNKPVSLRFSWWGDDNRHKSTLAMIDLYQKAHSNVTIEPEYGGWDGYQEKLTTQLAGGTAPDLMQVSYSWISDLQKKGGFFSDLSKYPQLIDLGIFPGNLLNAFCNVDNAMVAVPTGASAYAFVVNKDTLAKAGVQADQKWTWDSLLDAARKVHALGNDYYLTYDGTKETLYVKYLIPYVQATTGTNLINDDYTIAFSKENLVSALNYIKALNDNFAWAPVTQISSSTSIAEDPGWINGKVASTLGLWVSSLVPAVQAIGDAADVEIFPTLPGGKDTAIFTQPSMLLSVNAKSENIEATVSFLNSMFSDEESIKALKDCRGIPCSTKGLEIAETEKFVDPLVTKCLKLATDNSTNIPYKAINDDDELATAAEDVLEALTFGKLTPDAAADEIISRFNTRLADMKAAK